MNQNKAIELAEAFLKLKKIEYVSPGQIVNTINETIEVSFPSTDTLIPGTVVDPPDIRVFVCKDGTVKNVLQMRISFRRGLVLRQFQPAR